MEQHWIALLLRCNMIYGLLSLYLLVGVVVGTDRTCEPIRIDTCYEIGYNVTGMPNLVGHELQQDAQLQLQTFTPLIQYGCSSRLRFFLCSVYVPMCTEKVPVPIGPCRALCEDVRDKCQPVLQEFGFPWPAGLNCSKFPPQNNDKHMCMEGPADQKGPDSNNMRIRNRNSRPIVRNPDIKSILERKAPYSRGMSQHYGLCKKFRHSEHYYYINRTQRCAALCKADINFSHESKYFADLWLTIWSVMCFVCTFFYIFVVVLGDCSTCFRYPEGAILYISCCYNARAVAYLIRIAAGRYASSCHLDSQHNTEILIQEGLDNVNCTIIFVILYFFKMATEGWWVVLCVTWYLTNYCKWRPENFLHLRTYFHLFAWGIPCVMTIIVLVTRVIDADELNGICYVGSQSKDNLLKFVILPSFFYVATGIIFSLMSFLPSRHRPEIYAHVQANPVHRIPESEDSVASVTGIFMYLYILPACCVIGADIYEFMYRDSWFDVDSKIAPVVEVFSLKFFMLQIMGVAACLVVFSSDAKKRAFRKLFRSITRQKKPVPSYLQVQPQLMNAACRSKRSISSKANSETVV